MQTATYRRTPLTVEAVQVSAENIYEVAKWCNGDVHSINAGTKKFIQVNVIHPLAKKQTEANIGDWILKSNQGYKIYGDVAFNKGFEPVVTIGDQNPEIAAALHEAFDPGHTNIPL